MVKGLTQSERRTYQALVARGISPEDALEDALDGVQVEEARKLPVVVDENTSERLERDDPTV